MKKIVSDLQVKDKTVLVRVDFNVPLIDGEISDDNRIMQALPTINYLLDNGAKVVLLSHLGKVNHKDPEKTPKDMKKNDMKFLTKRLVEIFGDKFHYCDENKGEKLESMIKDLKSGEVLLMQNTRYQKGESKNDPELGEYWASLGDAFVMDAFGSAHRAHASTYGIPFNMEKNGKETAIGFLVEKEVKSLTKCVEGSLHPYVAVLGGVKVSDKIKVIEGLMKKADKIIIGGAMAYTFLKTLGCETGNSIIDNDSLDFAKKCLEEGKDKIVLPLDFVCTDNFKEPTKIVKSNGRTIPEGFEGVDIGEESIKEFTKVINSAKMVFWNGPMGVFENDDFAKGTTSVCKAITEVPGVFSVIGGGDSASAALKLGYKEKFSHVSTGGGASLEMVQNDGHLPGIDIIQDK